MDQNIHKQSGFYTANLLGTIKSHLASLQGYDVMALELIQNADDAKAESIAFNITDQGLLVTNSGTFTYCGDLKAKPCSLIARNNYSCDYHRIADVGSGGKLSRGENIGRFGIGFVSTYQVTDHPEIRSAGVKLKLRPEDSAWDIEPFEQHDGTTFFLPWADDPNTQARRSLGVSHITAAHIDQLVDDLQKVLRKSLLFLRHVRTAEVWRNGKLLLACDLDRGNGTDLIVSFRPSGEIERWHLLRTDVAEAAARLYTSHPRLESLGRRTTISIGLRIKPEPLTTGVLYAFLPTEQSTGLPMHINADFFPESNRKAVIFSGHQHEQAWNEMLIDAAASELAKDPDGLRKMLGDVQLWKLLEQAIAISNSPNYPNCFKKFWAQLKVACADAPIVSAQDGSVQIPSKVFLPECPVTSHQETVLLEIGGRLVREDLRRFSRPIKQLGAQTLNLDQLIALLKRAIGRQVPGTVRVEAKRLESFHQPLWALVNELLSVTTNTQPATIAELQSLPFIVTEDRWAVTIKNSHLLPTEMTGGRVASLLPKMQIAAHQLDAFPQLAQLFTTLDLRTVVNRISQLSLTYRIEEIISDSPEDLRDLYSMIEFLGRKEDDQAIHEKLRRLRIWRSSSGSLIEATQALLPGDFTDLTGQADFLDTSVLTDRAKEFVTSKLGVQKLTIQAFAEKVLPRCFDQDGPVNVENYRYLITLLASHPVLLDDESIRRRLGELPIVPTQNGGWSRPTNTYRRTDDLVRVLGDDRRLWLDASRVPNTRSVHTFIDSLGLRQSPLAQHLVERMLFIAKTYPPTEDAKRASGEAFYVLCDRYDEWKHKPFFSSAINRLRGVACLPAEGDSENWHSGGDLYAPYRAEAFRSQANILDFKSTARLKTKLLEDLDVTTELETRLVIDHLQYCMKTGTQPHITTYQVLNERVRSDPQISTLAGTSCIYSNGQKAFVRPNQVYWTPPQLGRYAFTIEGDYEMFKPLFSALGVKNAPEGKDYVAILLDIVGEYFEQSKPVRRTDRSVYDACLLGLSAADERGEIDALDIQRLQEQPTILNLLGQPTYPDEVLLQDSEWHAGFFNGELDRALCKLAPELLPFIEKVGVRRLSESAEVALEFVDGNRTEEPQFAERLIERIDILIRLLHDKPTPVKQNVRKALSELTAISYELVRIKATVQVGGNWVSAPPSAAHAFYDIDKRQLILARPVGDRSWHHVLNAIFHQLMPEESGSEISKLTLSVRPLMSMPVEEAHRELTDAGIPDLDAERASGQADDLTSSRLDDIGSTTDPAYQEESKPDAAPADAPQGGERAPERPGTGRPTGERKAPPNDVPSADQGQAISGLRGRREKDASDGDRAAACGHSTGASNNEKSAKTPRPKHKEQWDRRLLSYVRKKQEESADAESLEGPSEHNLAVEVVARAAVCAYERARGRVAEQMAHTHPGYDIISRNPLTGEDRFIEVKGVYGEWNRTGVGLSRLQFSNAQNYGDRYWLYVVEFVSDPQYTRVHPIRSPATQVTSFMFDGNWRLAVADERADPALAFIAGARVKHQHFGCGRIESVELRGSTRVMSIQFVTSGTRTVTLNLQTMTVVEEDDDNDHS